MDKENALHPDRLSLLHERGGFVHPDFGDLLRPDAVVMDEAICDQRYCVSDPYFFHLTVTGRCNAHCKGCVNRSISFPDAKQKEYFSAATDLNPERDARAVISLLEVRSEQEVWICFYGGEPLLEAELMGQFIDELEKINSGYRFRYMLYTNGQLLDRFVEQYPKLAEMVSLISVSIDGQRDQHNRIREGTDLEKIERNLETLKTCRRGSVLMWSTLREGQSLLDCFKEFLSLSQDGRVDHFFWHWVETQESFGDFAAYLQRYEQDLRGILAVYLYSLRQGKLLSLIHINELVLFLLTGTKRNSTGCGVEKDRNLDLMGGCILACADLGPDWSMGTVGPDGRIDLKRADYDSLVAYKKQLGCEQCGVHGYCGGRCPVEAIDGDWLRLIQYCQLMRLHVGCVQQILPEAWEQMQKHGIPVQQIYDQSAYTVQFTDVTP